MSMGLAFNGVQFEIVSRDGQPWVTSRQLALALGYKDENSVRKIYERNKEEFSSMMTATVNMTVGITEVMVRIFSMRGCHLVGMFARTPVAKAFRRWVLDVIEKYGDQVPVAHPMTINDSSMTPEQQARLHAVVDAKVSMVPKPYRRQAYKEIWTRFNRHFQIARYVQLPAEKVEDGIEYLLAMQVNAGKAQALEQASLPPAERYSFTMFSGNDCLEFAREIEEAHKKVFDLYEGLRVKGIKISTKLMDEVENRVRKGCRCGGWPADGFDRIFSQLMTASLCDALLYVDRELPAYRNPGMTLYSLAMGMNPASRANGRA